MVNSTAYRSFIQGLPQYQIQCFSRTLFCIYGSLMPIGQQFLVSECLEGYGLDGSRAKKEISNLKRKMEDARLAEAARLEEHSATLARLELSERTLQQERDQLLANNKALEMTIIRHKSSEQQAKGALCSTIRGHAGGFVITLSIVSLLGRDF